MIPAWVAQYVGIPAAKGKCFALVRRVLAEQFQIDLPSYDEPEAQPYDREEIAAMLAGEPVKYGREVALKDASAGDVIIFRVRGVPAHIGIVVAPPWMLHMHPALGSVVERYDSWHWKERIEGVFRDARR